MVSIKEKGGKNYLDIPALSEWQKFQSAFYFDEKNRPSASAYFKRLVNFFEWYLQYTGSILKGKTCTYEQVCQVAFREMLPTKHIRNEFYKKHFYISREYILHLREKITSGNIRRYRHVLIGLLVDIQELIARHEVIIKKSVDTISLTAGRRKDLSPFELFHAAKDLFFIEEKKSVRDIYLRDLKPVVMFQIRQLLELYGRNIVGYYSILDPQGNTVKRFTQVAWEFIKDEIKKKDTRIVFPFDVHMILEINSWAHGFVHTTYIHNSYLQFFALKVLKVLFTMPKDPVLLFDGRRSRNSQYAAITISHYNSLKRDFEVFLKKKMAHLTVEWMDTKHVGAYIISL